MNKINNKLELNKEGIREDFCPPCLALIPLAFAGAGTSVSATMCAEEKDKHYKDKQRTKNILFWSSIIIGIISLIIFILFKFVLCTKCR